MNTWRLTKGTRISWTTLPPCGSLAQIPGHLRGDYRHVGHLVKAPAHSEVKQLPILLGLSQKVDIYLQANIINQSNKQVGIFKLQCSIKHSTQNITFWSCLWKNSRLSDKFIHWLNMCTVLFKRQCWNIIYMFIAKKSKQIQILVALQCTPWRCFEFNDTFTDTVHCKFPLHSLASNVIFLS